MPSSQILLATTKSSASLPVVPFTLSLDASDNTRFGDTTTVQNNWWSSQTYDAGFVTNIGQQSYQGFYAFTAGKNATLTATLGGAAGFRNIRGRSITATFSIAVGDRIVFFAGKPSTNVAAEGAAGGASCLMKYGTSLSSDADYENGFVPLIIAAGGGEGGSGANQSYEASSAAPAYSVTTSNTSTNIMTTRNYGFPNANLVAKEGGAGRDNSAQSGGAGWKGPSRDVGGNAFRQGGNNPGVGLAYGAMGNLTVSASGSDGGFGGGGCGYPGNTYGAGAGGYYGGCEGTGGSYNSTSSYVMYSPTRGDQVGDVYGALSFVHSSGSTVTDNGLWGTHGGSTPWFSGTDSQQIKGRVYLSFT